MWADPPSHNRSCSQRAAPAHRWAGSAPSASPFSCGRAFRHRSLLSGTALQDHNCSFLFRYCISLHTDLIFSVLSHPWCRWSDRLCTSRNYRSTPRTLRSRLPPARASSSVRCCTAHWSCSRLSWSFPPARSAALHKPLRPRRNTGAHPPPLRHRPCSPQCPRPLHWQVQKRSLIPPRSPFRSHWARYRCHLSKPDPYRREWPRVHHWKKPLRRSAPQARALRE